MNIDRASRDELVIHYCIGIPLINFRSLVACLALLLVSALANTPFAQAQPPCGQGDGSGANIRGCANAIMNEQNRSIELLDEMMQELGAMNAVTADELAATGNS